jgi:hypothetical protein
MARRLVLTAFVIAVLGAGVAAFAPLGRSCSSSLPGSGQERCVGQSIVGIFSVGMFFVPAAVVMTVAAVMRDPRPAATFS